MFKALSICALIVSSLLFTGCESDPHIYNPNANYGSPEPGLAGGGFTNGGPIVGEGPGGFVESNPNGGVDVIPGQEGQGTPVEHPFTSPVYFAYDSAVVGQAYDDMLQTLADYMKSHGNYSLTVNGHCDDRGSEEYNRALSERRALAVKDAIIAFGAPADRINTVGYGEERAAAPGTSAEAYAANRRAEFDVFSK
jgi:peptidoglycan-associated lipoprotein